MKNRLPAAAAFRLFCMVVLGFAIANSGCSSGPHPAFAAVASPRSSPAAVTQVTTAQPDRVEAPAPGPEASAVPREPTPGAVRPLPAVFTRPAPSSMAELRAIERHVKELVTRATPAVVSVEVGFAEGSGVIVTPDGLILTAGHVCGRPNRDVKVTFPDGKTVKGKTLGALEGPDCGLIRITDPGPWPNVDIAGARQPAAGDWVLAIGHPGGFDRERSLVTRLGRVIEVSKRAIRTDCTITTGDSGGPLLDMHGRVIGIHSYISNGFDDNYHVPIARFVESWRELNGAGPAASPENAVATRSSE